MVLLNIDSDLYVVMFKLRPKLFIINYVCTVLPRPRDDLPRGPQLDVASACEQNLETQ